MIHTICIFSGILYDLQELPLNFIKKMEVDADFDPYILDSMQEETVAEKVQYPIQQLYEEWKHDRGKQVLDDFVYHDSGEPYPIDPFGEDEHTPLTETQIRYILQELNPPNNTHPKYIRPPSFRTLRGSQYLGRSNYRIQCCLARKRKQQWSMRRQVRAKKKLKELRRRALELI